VDKTNGSFLSIVCTVESVFFVICNGLEK
jgi:hypothetical protein